MPRTFIRPETQIKTLDAFNDQVAAGAALETATFNLEEFMYGILSQINRVIHTTVGGNDWYADLATPAGGAPRGINDLNTDLLDIEQHKFLCRSRVLTNITVPASQNWKILNVAGSEAPTQVAAVALTQNGAVVAQSALSGAGFDVHELTEIASVSGDPTSPRNLAVVRDATTGQALQSSGRDIFALVQYESTGVDGAAFDDTSASNRVKLSFVRLTAALNDLEAVPVADIENEVIHYAYPFRINLDAFPEDCFLHEMGFVDQAASVDVTRQAAYNNQGATPVELANNADLDLGAGIQWALRDAADADLLNLTEGSAGGTTSMTVGGDVDTYQNNAADVDFGNGATFDENGTPIDVGLTAGLINTSGAADLRVRGDGELLLDDGNFSAEATWAQAGVKVTETTAEITAYEAAFGGEVSLFNAIVQAYNSSSRTRADAVVTTDIPANTLIEGPGGPGTANIDADLVDYQGKNFVTEVEVFIGGELQRPGADASANHDVYPSAVGAEQAVGAFFAEYTLKASPGNADQISMFVNGA